MYGLKTAPKLNKYGWIVGSIFFLVFPTLMGVDNPLGIKIEERSLSGELLLTSNLAFTIFLYGLPMYLLIICYLWKAYWQEKSLYSKKTCKDIDYQFGLPSYLFACAFITFLNFIILNLVPAAIIINAK
jgi:hypothetical protein